MTAPKGGVSLVCFRQPEDAFFIVDLGGAGRWSAYHFDSDTKKSVPDDDAKAPAFGWLRAYVDGIEDGSAMPISSAKGFWEFPNWGAPTFTANQVAGKAVDERTAVLVDSSQLIAFMRYQNRFDKNIDYRLVIQLSTGRFSEAFTMESEKVPFSQVQGRCMRPTPK